MTVPILSYPIKGHSFAGFKLCLSSKVHMDVIQDFFTFTLTAGNEIEGKTFLSHSNQHVSIDLRFSPQKFVRYANFRPIFIFKVYLELIMKNIFEKLTANCIPEVNTSLINDWLKVFL